jgi:glucose-6-phosphate isomerase
MLIALYERAVGFYASLIKINAYHQPGVEAGKQAASKIISLKSAIRAALAASPEVSFTAESLAKQLGQPAQTELVFKVLDHLAANPSRQVIKTQRQPWFASTYRQLL